VGARARRSLVARVRGDDGTRRLAFLAPRRAVKSAWRAVQLAALLLAGCQAPPPRPTLDAAPIGFPTRFVLTFDDGPSTREPYNPTRVVLDTLAHNAVQPQIKAVFFVQTRGHGPQQSAARHALMVRIWREGHAVELHCSSPRTHRSPLRLSDAAIASMLSEGRADIRAATGADPTLVRPPLWGYDARTLRAYRAQGFGVLLTDIRAYDGKIYGWNASLRRRSHFRAGLGEVKAALAAGRLPVVDGAAPVVVAFHDTNTFTASHLEEYLQILVDESRQIGLPTAVQPFYNEREEIVRAAVARSIIASGAAAQMREEGWTFPARRSEPFTSISG
jgi:peptidoglycan/xylan/chitin deacetylase (PgdA/CDA1 family)